MDDLNFLKLAHQISLLTQEQRDQLTKSLDSRLWLYQTRVSRIECLDKLTDEDMETLLSQVTDDHLAYALLATSPILHEKCRTAIGEIRYTKVTERQKKITPARFSEVCRARDDILRIYRGLVYQLEVDDLCLLDKRIDTLDDMEHHSDTTTEMLVAQIILYLDDLSLQHLLQKIGNNQTLARVALASHSSLVLRKILLNVSGRTGRIILSDLFETPASQPDMNNTLLTFFESLNALSLFGQIAFPIELQEKLIYPWLQKNCPDSVLHKRLTLSISSPSQLTISLNAQGSYNTSTENQ